jgi:hypothetical protein
MHTRFVPAKKIVFQGVARRGVVDIHVVSTSRRMSCSPRRLCSTRPPATQPSRAA